MKSKKKNANEITFDELETLTLDKLGERSSGCYGFYDWFCHDWALRERARRLLGVLRKIAKTGTKAFDPEKCYVFFKNNCPGQGALYDDLRICDKKSDHVLINVCPSRHEIWAESNDWDGPVFKSDRMSGIYSWFKAR